jgi:hypothetical protein
MSTVGYEHLREALHLSALPPRRPALVNPVARLTEINGCLAVPRNMAPRDDDYLERVLFALKHEGTNLAILAQRVPGIVAC